MPVKSQLSFHEILIISIVICFLSLIVPQVAVGELLFGLEGGHAVRGLIKLNEHKARLGANRKEKSQLDEEFWKSDRSGIGLTNNAAAVGGFGIFGEVIEFDGESVLYCGGTMSATSDAQISGKPYKVKTLNCKKDSYTGGFLVMDLSATLPAFEIGGGISYSLGVSDDFPQKLAETMKYIESHSHNVIKNYSDMGPEIFSNLFSDIRGNDPLEKAMTISMGIIQPLLSSFVPGGVVGVSAKNFSFGKSLRDLVSNNFQFKSALRNIMNKMKNQKTESKTEYERGVYDFYLTLLGNIESALTGCDSLSIGPTIGLGLLPITASLSYSHYTKLVEFPTPDKLFRNIKTLSTNVASAALGAGKHGPECALTALKAVCSFDKHFETTTSYPALKTFAENHKLGTYTLKRLCYMIDDGVDTKDLKKLFSTLKISNGLTRRASYSLMGFYP